MQGLAEYIRTLLIAKDARLHSLMIGSKKKIQRASEQAGLATPSFLINALALINDAEVSYQRALNKRLHVEVCLIRIAHASQVLEGGATKKKTAELDKASSTVTPPQSNSTSQDTRSDSPSIETKEVAKSIEPRESLEEASTHSAATAVNEKQIEQHPEKQNDAQAKETPSTQIDTHTTAEICLLTANHTSRQQQRANVYALKIWILRNYYLRKPKRNQLVPKECTKNFLGSKSRIHSYSSGGIPNTK